MGGGILSVQVSESKSLFCFADEKSSMTSSCSMFFYELEIRLFESSTVTIHNKV